MILIMAMTHDMTMTDNSTLFLMQKKHSELGTQADTRDFEKIRYTVIHSIHHADSEYKVFILQSLTVFEKSDPIRYDFHVYSAVLPVHLTVQVKIRM